MNLKFKYFSKNPELNSNELISLLDSCKNAELAFVEKSTIRSTLSALICYEDANPIGICGIKHINFEKTIYIFVNEKYTNIGIGSKLLKEFIKESLKKNISLYLFTKTGKRYLAAYNLYIKNNFEPIFIINKNVLLTHQSLPLRKRTILIIYFIFIEILRTLKLCFSINK